MFKKSKFWAILSVVLVASMLLAACATPAPTAAPQPQPQPAPSDISCEGVTAGDQISMLYQWSGQEEERLNAILKPFVDACGVAIVPEASRDQALLDTKVQAGTPPDVVFWGSTQLKQYAEKLVAMDALGVDAANYADYWKAMGTIDGKLLGLPVKADIKSIVWYSPKAFTEAGYTVPTTWEELDTLVEKMVADGKVPWSMGMESGDATGWTGTDFIEDIILVKQGPEYVDAIIAGTTPYNDPGVQEAYEIYGKWAKDEKYTIGGAAGTVSTNFNDAINKVFSTPPEAMMVKQSGFAAGQITTTYPTLVYGEDFDFFQVPGVKGLQGGADWGMAFSDKPAVKALFAYLASNKGGEEWAKVGFDLTPNKAGTTTYEDASLAKKAEMLAATTGFVADIGDAIPGFGVTEFRGVTDWVNGGDLAQILSTIAAAQAEGTK